MKMEKRSFRIGELAKNLGVERFVVRFWEKEFGLSAHRSEGGQRYYTENDVRTFTMIKELLYRQGFTIAGAKNYLRDYDKPIRTSSQNNFPENGTFQAIPAVRDTTTTLSQATSFSNSTIPEHHSQHHAHRVATLQQYKEQHKEQLRLLKTKLLMIHQLL